MTEKDVILLSSEEEQSDGENEIESKRCKLMSKEDEPDFDSETSGIENGGSGSSPGTGNDDRCISAEAVITLDDDDDDLERILEEVVPEASLTPKKAESNSDKIVGKLEPVAVPTNDSDDVIPIVTPTDLLKDEARNSLQDYIYYLKDRMKANERKKVKDKLEADFEKIHFDSEDTAKEVKMEIDKSLERLKSRREEVWTPVKKLLDYFKSKMARAGKPQNRTRRGSKADGETAEQRIARKKEERRIQLEKKLKRIEKEIEEYDLLEVDLDDDRNSSYLIRTRMINRYMKVYKILCRSCGCNYYTGRPVEKRIKLKDICRFPEVNGAVEKYMNSKPTLFIPDFYDIKRIVTEVNNKAKPSLMANEDIHSTAKDLFTEVIQIMRHRRRQDLEIAVPLETSEEKDPAENDPELLRKLQENDTLRRSEKEIIESYVQKQEEANEDAEEVMDSVDSSAEESDDEDEEEDLSAEHDKNEEEGEAPPEKQVFTREECEDESDDEELVAEIAPSNQNDLKDDILNNGKPINGHAKCEGNNLKE